MQQTKKVMEIDTEHFFFPLMASVFNFLYFHYDPFVVDYRRNQCKQFGFINVLRCSPMGLGKVRFLRSPSTPAAIIAAKPKCGLAHASNDLISKLLTRPSGTPGGHAVLIGASLFSLPQHKYAPLQVLGCIRS